MDFATMTHDQILDYIAGGFGPMGREYRYREVQLWRKDQERQARADLLASEQTRTGITVSTPVRRKTGKANTGTVERMFVRDGKVMADVHWSNAVRWLGGKSDWHSTLRLSSLVKVEA